MRMHRTVGLRFCFVALAVICFATASANRSTAATRFWRNSAGNSTWNTAANWSSVSAADTNPANNGVPVAGEPVNIVNSDALPHTVTLNVNAPPAGQLGILRIDYTGAGAGANTLSATSGNNLTAGAILVGGHNGTTTTNGRGAITQSAGTITTAAGGDFVLANGAGSTGTYTLSGGNLTANQSQYIGLSGTGVFNHTGGTNTINASAVGAFDLGVNPGSSGTYNLNGAAANFFSSENEYIGDQGIGIFNHTNGFHNLSGDMYLGFAATGNGTYTISAGQVNILNAFVGNAGSGTMNIQGTGTVNLEGLTIGATGNVNINGGKLRATTIPFGSLAQLHWNSGIIELRNDRNMFSDTLANNLFSLPGISGPRHGIVEGIASVNGGSLNAAIEIKDGGAFTSLQGRIGTESGTEGTVTVTGLGSVWNVTNATLVVGGTGSNGATLNIRDGGLVAGVFGIELVASTNGVVNLDGGTIQLNTFNESGGSGVFNFNSGTVDFTGNRSIGSDESIKKTVGAAPVLTAGKELAIEGTATLLTTVTLDGGTFTAPTIVNGQYLALQRGRLSITNQAVTISPTGLFGSTLDLNDDMTLNVNSGITNQGLVTGDGQIGGTFTNAATGELRAEPGKSLKLTGGSNTNSGQINLLGGLIEYTSSLTNNATGFISGNGTLKTNNLTNSGTMNFSGLANILGDVTNNSGAKIISSGGGPTTFHDDVTNNGEIRTSAGSFTTFYGAATGSGTYTGTGTVNFEGDLKPGSSPAIVQFGGSVSFGIEAALQIEIGGTTPGTQHDQLDVVGDLALAGVLEISLLPGFTPTAGQSFNILDWDGTLSGNFSETVFPTLAGLTWNTSQLYTNGIISLAAAGLAGDYNADGIVDAVDYTVWRNNLGDANEADLNNNGDGGQVTDSDYTWWKQRYGNTSPGSGGLGTGVGGIVPEPTSWLLAFFAAVSGMACTSHLHGRHFR